MHHKNRVASSGDRSTCGCTVFKLAVLFNLSSMKISINNLATEQFSRQYNTKDVEYSNQVKNSLTSGYDCTKLQQSI